MSHISYIIILSTKRKTGRQQTLTVYYCQAAMKIKVLQQDITTLKVDAIVNAANKSLSPGGGVCGAIYRAAGEELAHYCESNGLHCDVGKALIMPGFRLPSGRLIQTVGPDCRNRLENISRQSLLRSCYLNSLSLAAQNNICSIGFPAISTGIFQYPLEEAARVAIQAMEESCYQGEIIVCCADPRVFEVYNNILGRK